MSFEKRNGHSKKIAAMGFAAIIIAVTIIATIYYWPNDHGNNIVTSQFARYSFNYTLDFTSNVAGEAQLNLTIPTSSPNFQDVQHVNFSVDPSWIITDEQGNRIAHFIVNIAPGKVSEISILVLVELNETPYTIPFNYASYNSTSQIFQEYTKPEEYVESDNPMIIEVAGNITSSYNDPLNVSKVICTWVNQNLNYSGFSSEARGALWALTNKNGDCTEYSDLFIALCRAKGIPARLIDGMWLPSVNSSGTQSWEKVGHDWAEVYFQGRGWIWVDPTSDQFASNDGRHMAIQLGQYCSSLSGEYRYYFTGNANVTEHFDTESIG
jgi:transglutaminase-like putative cysteine protease